MMTKQTPDLSFHSSVLKIPNLRTWSTFEPSIGLYV